jgi:hypothetical protein
MVAEVTDGGESAAAVAPPPSTFPESSPLPPASAAAPPPSQPLLSKRWIYLMVAGDFGLAFTWVMVCSLQRRVAPASAPGHCAGVTPSDALPARHGLRLVRSMP